MGVVHIFGCIIWLWKVVGAGLQPDGSTALAKQEIELFLDTIPWGSTGHHHNTKTKLSAWAV